MKNHIAFKFIAIVLCAAMLALSLGCGAAVAVLADNGLFDRSIEQMRQDRLDSACWDMAYYIASDYVLENLSNCPEEVLAMTGAYSERDQFLYSGYAQVFKDGQWYYTLQNKHGRTLAGDRDIPEGLTTFEATISWSYPVEVGMSTMYVEEEATTAFDATAAVWDEEAEELGTTPAVAADSNLAEAAEASTEVVYTDYEYVQEVWMDDQTYALYYLRTENSPEYTVTLYLTEDAFPIYEAADWMFMELAQQYRYYLIGGLVAGVLLVAISLVYLCCAAGRKPGTDEVSPQAFNRLPLDLYAVGGTLGIGGLLALVGTGIRGLDYSYSGESWLPPVFLIAAAAVAGCLLVVGFVFACAAQFKMPGVYWLRHTVMGFCCVYGWKGLVYLLGLLVKFCRWLVKTLPPFVKKAFMLLWKCLCFLWHMLVALLQSVWKSLRRCARWLGRRIARVYSLLPLTWQWMLTGFLLILIMAIAIASREPLPLLIGLSISIAVILYGANCFGILQESAKRMGKGDLDTKVSDQFLTGSFKEFAGDLNALADVAVVAAEKQMRSERMKAELVTNVSHDIKTPLTSIINYVDLLQKARNQEEAEQYLEVLERQSQRMKKLIEDLMEMSKATTGNLSVEIQRVDAVEAVNQALGEFSDKLAATKLTPIFAPPETPVNMLADGRLAWRVLSNLLSNAVKYALPGTRLYIDLITLEGKVLISLKNISKEQLNVSSDELMERFVRGDASRNTEGSGLGLNIAKSLMELQHGQLQLLVDGDLFKATLVFPAAGEE